MGLATGVAVANSMDNFKHLNGSFSKEILANKNPMEYVPYYNKYINNIALSSMEMCISFLNTSSPLALATPSQLPT